MKPRTPDGADTRETRRLATLLEMSQALSGTLNLKTSLHRVLEILGKRHGAVQKHRHPARRRGRSVHRGGRRPRRAGAEHPLPGRRRHHRPRGREQQADCRAAGQPRAGLPAPGVTAIRVVPRRAQLRLRAGSDQPQGGGRARRRSAVQGGARLRQQREVHGGRRVDDRAGAEGAARGRGRAPASAGRKHASAPGTARALRLLEHHRHERAGSGNVRADRPGRQDEHHGADSRGIGHRQGADCPRHPLQLAARQEAVRQGELRGAARQPDRIRALRIRERARSPARSSERKAASSWPRAGRCSSTKSATSTWARR